VEHEVAGEAEEREEELVQHPGLPRVSLGFREVVPRLGSQPSPTQFFEIQTII
jgi:hypothetical protein